MLSDKSLFQSQQFLGMPLGEFFRSCRWDAAQFARGLLQRGLDSSFLLLYQTAELFLLEPASVTYKIDYDRHM